MRHRRGWKARGDFRVHAGSPPAMKSGTSFAEVPAAGPHIWIFSIPRLRRPIREPGSWFHATAILRSRGTGSSGGFGSFRGSRYCRGSTAPAGQRHAMFSSGRGRKHMRRASPNWKPSCSPGSHADAPSNLPRPDPRIPAWSLTPAPAHMPLPALMLRVCGGGDRTLWCGTRRVAGRAQNHALSPLRR